MSVCVECAPVGRLGAPYAEPGCAKRFPALETNLGKPPGCSQAIASWAKYPPPRPGVWRWVGGLAPSAVRSQCNYLGVWPYWRPML